MTAATTIPSILVYLAPSRELAIAMLWIFVPAIYFYIGPILGLLQNLVPAGARAQACAVLLFTANIANLVVAPQLIGIMSDQLAMAGLGRESLRWALVIMAPTGFWAAWHLWTCGRTIFEHQVVKSGTFSLSHPLAEGAMRLTGVTLEDDVPSTLGRDVQFIKGSTYETLAPFLADRPGVPIGLFHMDLDTYESCLHALETCKSHFVEGSVLVFDEYLVTSGEIRAFFEFQSKYGLEWHYRAWGLEIMEMNLEMIISPWKRSMYYLMWMAWHFGIGDGSYVWAFFRRPFWRFWLGAPAGDIAFMLGAAGQRKSVSLEITGLGKLDRTR